jgi:hypothetical protein
MRSPQLLIIETGVRYGKESCSEDPSGGASAIFRNLSSVVSLPLVRDREDAM